MPGSGDEATERVMVQYQTLVAHSLGEVIDSRLFDAALDLHMALLLTDRHQANTHIESALAALNAAILDVRTVAHMDALPQWDGDGDRHDG
jgi:hypothetical protein